MAYNDKVKASPAELRALAADIKSCATALDESLVSLQNGLRPIIAQYVAGSGEEYEQVQKNWDSSATDLKSVLDDIAKATNQAADDYETTETQNLKGWMGGRG